jgi:hypothetical protein
LPGRDEAIVSPAGASLYPSAAQLVRPDLISADGRRIFFMSPEPTSATSTAPCTGTGAGTSCPPQLYMREELSDGSFATRWLSRSEIPGQAASLAGPTFFSGASADGDKVFFETNSPLTADDRNGLVAPPPGGVTSGSVSSSSWDLYQLDLTDSSADDPGAGSLTRISAGPVGSGDCNVINYEASRFQAHPISGMRLAAADGNRVYFTCSAPLPGVPAPANGTISSPGGTPNTEALTNIYLYDSGKPVAERWQLVARLPRANNGSLAACATSGPMRAGMRLASVPASLTLLEDLNCVSGTADASFITFWTQGRLTADDPDGVSVDMYAFDASSNELVRIDSPQGGTGGTYPCLGSPSAPTARCFGDPGFSGGGSRKAASAAPPRGVAVGPDDVPVAYFESASSLLHADTDDLMDVYQWRAGKLSLLTPGTDEYGAYYSGNSEDGEDVFVMTRARLTWRDTDAAVDAYDVRVGGGFPEPLRPPACDVLTGACQVPPSSAPVIAPASSAVFSGAGNLTKGSPGGKGRHCPKGKVRRGKKCVAHSGKRAKRTERRAAR